MERRRIASIYDRRIRTSLVPEVANIFQYYQRAIIIAIVIIFFDFVKFRHDRYLSSSIFEISISGIGVDLSSLLLPSVRLPAPPVSAGNAVAKMGCDQNLVTTLPDLQVTSRVTIVSPTGIMARDQ